MKKRLLAMLMAMCMIVGLLPATAFAQEPMQIADEVFESDESQNVAALGTNTRAGNVIELELGGEDWIDGKIGTEHHWTSSNDNAVTVNGTGVLSGDATIKAVGMSDEPVTITHFYKDWGQDRSETFQVQVTLPKAKFFLLKAAGIPPEGAEDQGKDNYYPNGTDTIVVNGETYTEKTGLPGFLTEEGYQKVPNIGDSYFGLNDNDPVDQTLVVEPESDFMQALREKAELIDEQDIVWYAIKRQEDGYHVDGYVSNIPVRVTYKYVDPQDPNNTKTVTDDTVTASDYRVLSLEECDFTAPDGYTFAGWKLEDEGSHEKDTFMPGEKFALMTNETFVAQWDKAATGTLTVKYVDDSNNTLKTTTDNIQVGESYKVEPDESIEVDGVTYLYDKDSTATGSLTGTMTEDGVTVTLVYTKDENKDGTPDKNQVLVKYVSANADMGTVWGKIESFEVPTDQTAVTVVTPQGMAMPKAGYTFDHWTVNYPTLDTLKDPALLESHEFKDVPAGTVITFTAYFTAESEYTLTFNAGLGKFDDGTIMYQQPVREVDLDADGNFKVELPNRVTMTAPEDAVFAYWTADSEKADKIYGRDDTVLPARCDEVSFRAVKDQTVYAVWSKDENGDGKPDISEDTYTLTIDANGGTIDGSASYTEPTKYWAGDRVKPSMKLEGHTFQSPENAALIGWSDDQNVVGRIYGAEEQLPSLVEWVVFSDEDVTVYAVWGEDKDGDGKPDGQDEKYTLHYDDNGGTGAPADQTGLTVGQEVTLDSGAQMKYGDEKVVFAGWSTDSAVRHKIYGEDDEKFPTLTTQVKIKEDEFQTNTVYAVWGYDENGNGVADAYEITITPADISVYMGGNGYEGTVTDGQGGTAGEGTKNGFPEPGFTIKLPASISAEDFDVTKLMLTYTGDSHDSNEDENQDYKWEFKPYDGNFAHNTVYRIVPAGNTEGRPIRMEFTKTIIEDGNETVITITQDNFKVGLNLNQTLTMKVYGEGIQEEKVSFLYDNQPYGIAVDTGNLIVRGTTGGAKYDNVNQADVEAGKPGAVAEKETTYYINGDQKVEVSDPKGVALLFDDVIDALESNQNRHQQLEDRAEKYFEEEEISAASGNVFDYEFKYLDLVDTNNGNAWVQADKDVTISWPLPEGTTKDTEFKLLHFEGLHREQAANEVADSIAKADVETIKIVEVTDTHVVFKAGKDGFSPFALVWETKAPDVTLTYYPNGGSGSVKQDTYTQGAIVQVSGNMFSRTNYVFTGWNTAANGTGVSYAPGKSITLDSSVALYAQWSYVGGDGGTSTSDDYTLHYVTNGGEKLSSETESHPWTKDYRDLPTPERDGYTFVGWYWDLRLTDPVSEDIKIDKSTVDIYAKWEKDGEAIDTHGVSDWLDTVNHRAYLNGYPGQTFGADRNMTRAEAAQMFYSLLLDKDVKITKTFTDVPADAWYADAVNTLASLDMLSGYPDGTFQPNRTITRAEFAVMALGFADRMENAVCSYYDVRRDDWFHTYVAQASEYGWIGGYPDGTFRPNNMITRAEVCVIVNNMLGRDADKRFIDRNGNALNDFVDLPGSHWAFYAITEATNSHKYTLDYGEESWDRVTGV